MKTIRILCDAFGESKVIDNRNLVFSNENETIKLIITYPSELNSYRKRLDIYVDYDKTLDYFESDSETLEVILKAEHLKQGIIKVQPIAYLVEIGEEYLDSIKQKWKALKFEVQYSINTLESDTTLTPSIAEYLQLQITVLDENKMNLNGDNSNVDVLSFKTNTLVALSQVGQLRWNNDLRTLELRLSNDVTLALGNETLLRAMNKQGSTILNGKACYLSGGAGANIYTKLATNTDGLIAQSTIGVATEDLLNNESGYICTEGIVNGINTNAWNEGDILYLGTNGDLINVEPIAPTPKIFVGVCLRSHGSLGSIYVKVRAVPRLSRLSDVYIDNLQNGDVLVWNSINERWENKQLALSDIKYGN